MEERKCKVCGKIYKPKSFNQATCGVECRKEYNRTANRERQRKLRNFEKVVYKKKCPICGKEFSTENSVKIYCGSKCQTSWYARKKTAKRLKEEAYQKERERRKPKNSISDIASKARSLGMSYGEYEAQKYKSLVKVERRKPC